MAINWLAYLEGMEEFYRWQREDHPRYPDILLEWGLYHHLRGALTSEAGAGEEAAVPFLAEGDRALAALAEKGTDFPDFRCWRDWTASQRGETAPDAEALRAHFHAMPELAGESLVDELIAELEPLDELPAALRRAALCPAFRRLFASTGEYLAFREQLEAAAAFYALAVLVGGRVERHWIYRAELARAGGNPDAARAALEEGLSRHPDDIELLRETAQELERAGDPAAAAALLEKAVALQPNWPDLRYDLARCLRESESPERSLEQFSKALELNPGYERAAVLQAEILYELGDLEQAERQLEELKARQVQPQRVYRLLSRIYAERKDERRAGRFGLLAQDDAGESV